MNTPLTRLIYISNNRIDGDDDTIRHEIDSILKVARQANSEAGITGALMFNKGCFAQVLEGKQDDIEETFERIQCDQRHSDIVILSIDSIDQRAFTSWSMGYVGDDQTVEMQFERIRDTSGFDPTQIPSDSIFDLLYQNLIEAETSTPASNRHAA